MKAHLVLGLILLLCMATPGLANQGEALTKPSPKVQELIDKLQLQVVGFDYVKETVGKGTRKGAKALLIDARPNAKYVKGTIPSSINIPDTKFDDYYAQIEQADMSREVIVFCGGWKCGKSPKVANMLIQKGFQDVKLYQAGEPDWAKRDYLEVDTQVVKAAQESNGALIIDARPYKKYLQSTIPGAIAIPDTDMESLIGRLPANKDEKIIAFCGGYDCGKSHKVAKKLLSLGYNDVTVYAGGLPKWENDGLATTGSGAVISPEAIASAKPEVRNGIPSGFDEGTIDGEWFKSHLLLKTIPENVQIVSVIPQEDFDSGYLKEAINIYAEPLNPEELFEQLPKDKVIVFSCTSGSRALEAWYKLNDAKLDTSRIYYFDANVKCEAGSECQIEVHEPIG